MVSMALSLTTQDHGGVSWLSRHLVHSYGLALVSASASRRDWQREDAMHAHRLAVEAASPGVFLTPPHSLYHVDMYGISLYH